MVFACETVQLLDWHKLHRDLVFLGISHNLGYLWRAQTRLYENLLQLLPRLYQFLDGMHAENHVGVVFFIVMFHYCRFDSQNYKIFVYHIIFL